MADAGDSEDGTMVLKINFHVNFNEDMTGDCRQWLVKKGAEYGIL